MDSEAEMTLDISKCSPGPWRVREHGSDFFIESPRQEGKPYGIDVLGDEDYSTKRADADFIVAAFNEAWTARQK